MQYRQTITVLIVDEQPIVRWGIQHFLQTQQIRVIGEAQSLSEALVTLQHLEPDVIILDTILPDADIVTALQKLTTDKPRRILAFSSKDSWDYVEKFINAGGLGFVPKRTEPDELVSAIIAVASNQPWISPSIRKITTGKTHVSDIKLSKREREVVVLIARGLTSRQIADQLCVSLKTVETHRYRIFKHLNIQSRAELVNFAFEHGLLDSPENHIQPK